MLLRPAMKLKFSSFDHRLLDNFVRGVMKIAENHKVTLSGPIPLPKQVIRRAVIKSPHVYKESGESFTNHTHKRLIILLDYNNEFIMELNAIHVGAGIGVEIVTVPAEERNESLKHKH